MGPSSPGDHVTVRQTPRRFGVDTCTGKRQCQHLQQLQETKSNAIWASLKSLMLSNHLRTRPTLPLPPSADKGILHLSHCCKHGGQRYQPSKQHSLTAVHVHVDAAISIKLTGFRLFSITSLRYTGCNMTRITDVLEEASPTTQRQNDSPFVLPSIAQALTPMPIMLSNAPPTSRLWFHQMYEGDTLRKTDRSCVWEQSNVAQSLAISRRKQE